MATLEATIRASVDRLESVPATFLELVNRQNAAAWKELLKAIEGLQDEAGRILATPENLAQLEVIAERMRQVLFSGDYIEGVRQFVSEFDSQSLLVNDIFRRQFESFSSTSLLTGLVEQQKRSVLALYEASAVDNVWVKPLTGIIQDNILTQGTRADLINALDAFVRGADGDLGHLSRYVSTTARDAFATFNRSYTMVIADQIGVQYFEYFGGQVPNSRDFCIEREGNVYDRKTIESWADLNWQGKRDGTNEATIYAFVGGYNCIHSLIPRPRSGGSKDLNRLNSLES